MATQIKVWQIVDGKLQSVDTTLADHGRREPEDLEAWIASEPSILGSDIVLIGRQVATQSGPLDLLGIDKTGNAVIIELKRDRLPREVLAQAIDYASDVATWSVERLSEECAKYHGKSLDDILSDTFDDVDIENLTINEGQRILLVGFGAEPSLERMVEWLSAGYDVNINAIILHYARTARGEELLMKTAIISAEEEQERIKRQKFKIAMSDEPGHYDDTKLRELLRDYLSSGRSSARRIRDVLLPACLAKEHVTRSELVEEFLRRNLAPDQRAAGQYISLISSQLGMAKNDFLRQVIGYEYPEFHWQKDNYHIRQGYREVVQAVLAEAGKEASRGVDGADV
jgi:hypothetical protein